jgi:cytoskeletal protein CcmA (bactofilin family)
MSRYPTGSGIERTALATSSRRQKDSDMPNTIIGTSIVVDGEISGDEDLVVQGTVKGKISLKENLIIDASGIVEADIESETVKISGQVRGNISANDRVELCSDGRMVGDIRAPRILIADGATFKGQIDMDVER